MTKDFDIIDLDDERTEKFAEVMRNPTSKLIYEHLKKTSASKTEISRDLHLPISTVHYSLEKLVKAGLVEENDFYWSPKGNKVYMYKASQRVMVFTPKKSRELSIHMMKTLGIIFVSVVMLAILIPLFTQESTPSKTQSQENILRFNSESELIQALKDSSNNQGGAYAKGEKMTLMAESGSLAAGRASMDASSGASNEYSKTNIQVEGVDESDIVKNDGKYIYTVSYNTLTIIDAYPGDEAKIIYNKTFDNFSPYNLFIDDDRLMIFGQSYQPNYWGEPEPALAAEAKIAAPAYLMPWYSSRASILIYDTSNKAKPKLIRQVDFEGNIIGSRKIEDYVYFAINSYPHYPILEQANADCVKIMPMMAEAIDGENISKEEPTPIAACSDVAYTKPVQANSFITMASISIQDKEEEIQKETILGNSWNIYASEDNFYLAQGLWNYGDEQGEETLISKFSLNEGDIAFVASNKIPGNILNQYSMDEFRGNFRIATTKTIYPKGYFDNFYPRPLRTENPDASNNEENEEIEKSKESEVNPSEIKEPTQINNLYILDEDLSLLGSLENLAPTERIYSARFMGDTAYLVTFKNVDPLFVLDLSNPKNPEVIGELKIPGFSNYLHPLGDHYLLGIGKDVDPSKITEEGRLRWDAMKGVKVSIFDISDKSNPKEIHKIVIGDKGSSSLAEYEPKSILIDEKKGLLVLPVTVINSKDTYTYSPEFIGVYVYSIDTESGFELRGKISHDFYKPKQEYVYPEYAYDYPIQRSLYIGENLYTLSSIGVKVNNLETLEEIKTLNLPQIEYFYPTLYSNDVVTFNSE